MCVCVCVYVCMYVNMRVYVCVCVCVRMLAHVHKRAVRQARAMQRHDMATAHKPPLRSGQEANARTTVVASSGAASTMRTHARIAAQPRGLQPAGRGRGTRHGSGSKRPEHLASQQHACQRERRRHSCSARAGGQPPSSLAFN